MVLSVLREFLPKCVKLSITSQLLNTRQGTLDQSDTSVEVCGFGLECSVGRIKQTQYLMRHAGNEQEAGLGNGLQKPCGLHSHLCCTGLGAFDPTKQVDNVVN